MLEGYSTSIQRLQTKLWKISAMIPQKTSKEWQTTSNWSFFSVVSRMSGLVKSGIFFVVHMNSKMNMTTSLWLISRKKKMIMKRSAKISDKTLEKMTKPQNLHLLLHFRRQSNLALMVMKHQKNKILEDIWYITNETLSDLLPKNDSHNWTIMGVARPKNFSALLHSLPLDSSFPILQIRHWCFFFLIKAKVNILDSCIVGILKTA